MYRLDRFLKLKSNVVSQRHINKLSKLHNQKSWHTVKIQQSLFAKRFITFHVTISQWRKKEPYLLVWMNISQQVWIVINFLLVKYLAKFLLPLGKNRYTINSTKSFVSFIKHQKVPDSHNMVSFDVVSLFTNSLLTLPSKLF